MRRLFLVAAGLAFGLLACDTLPCDDYISYVCTCHADDSSFDCAEIRRTYTDAPPDVQDTCVIALDDLQSEDEADGLVCAAGA